MRARFSTTERDSHHRPESPLPEADGPQSILLYAREGHLTTQESNHSTPKLGGFPRSCFGTSRNSIAEVASDMVWTIRPSRVPLSSAFSKRHGRPGVLLGIPPPSTSEIPTLVAVHLVQNVLTFRSILIFRSGEPDVTSRKRAIAVANLDDLYYRHVELSRAIRALERLDRIRKRRSRSGGIYQIVSLARNSA